MDRVIRVGSFWVGPVFPGPLEDVSTPKSISTFKLRGIIVSPSPFSFLFEYPSHFCEVVAMYSRTSMRATLNFLEERIMKSYVSELRHCSARNEETMISLLYTSKREIYTAQYLAITGRIIPDTLPSPSFKCIALPLIRAWGSGSCGSSNAGKKDIYYTIHYAK